MGVFRPPTDDLFNLSDFDVDQYWTAETRLAYGLFRHFEPLPRGRNVYKLADGSFVENEPSDMSNVTFVYYGGHEYPVSGQEETDLISAGYGGNIEAS